MGWDGLGAHSYGESIASISGPAGECYKYIGKADLRSSNFCRQRPTAVGRSGTFDSEQMPAIIRQAFVDRGIVDDSADAIEQFAASPAR